MSLLLASVAHAQERRPNILFILTDDQGWPTKLHVNEEQWDNAPLRAGIGTAYEGGLRVPCIVRWPGQIRAGTVEPTPVHVADWPPTLFAAAGASASAEYSIDGVNPLPLLRGGTLAPRALYWDMPLYDLLWAATPCAVIRIFFQEQCFGDVHGCREGSSLEPVHATRMARIIETANARGMVFLGIVSEDSIYNFIDACGDAT